MAWHDHAWSRDLGIHDMIFIMVESCHVMSWKSWTWCNPMFYAQCYSWLLTSVEEERCCCCSHEDTTLPVAMQQRIAKASSSSSIGWWPCGRMDRSKSKQTLLLRSQPLTVDKHTANEWIEDEPADTVSTQFRLLLRYQNLRTTAYKALRDDYLCWWRCFPWVEAGGVTCDLLSTYLSFHNDT